MHLVLETVTVVPLSPFDAVVIIETETIPIDPFALMLELLSMSDEELILMAALL